MVDHFARWLVAARTRREVARLSPRLRADIGLTDSPVVARQPVGMVHALAPDLLALLRDPAPTPAGQAVEPRVDCPLPPRRLLPRPA